MVQQFVVSMIIKTQKKTKKSKKQNIKQNLKIIFFYFNVQLIEQSHNQFFNILTMNPYNQGYNQQNNQYPSQFPNQNQGYNQGCHQTCQHPDCNEIIIDSGHHHCHNHRNMNMGMNQQMGMGYNTGSNEVVMQKEGFFGNKQRIIQKQTPFGQQEIIQKTGPFGIGKTENVQIRDNFGNQTNYQQRGF